ncbi:MAG TPA: pilus assembly protein TadG-related protein [Vineibacter sp.]|nr:pilus assembly protein TadG-related protein [Vineibacter sp.]
MPQFRLPRSLRSLFSCFRADQAGGLLILVAFASPLVVGGLAAGVETGMWYLVKRQAQQQADTAALGAARAKSLGITNNATLSALATRDAERNGFPNSAPNSIVINDPAAVYAGFNNTVQATVTQAVPLQFSKYFMSASAVTITARAVAGTLENNGPGGGCILALHPTASAAVGFSGSITADLNGCTIVANSNHASAVRFNGAVVVNAHSIYTLGGIDEIGAVNVTLSEPAQTHQSAPMSDPYATLTAGSLGGCAHSGYSRSGGTVTLSPGVYCNGIQISGSTNVYMTPGTYYIDKGDFRMTGHSSVSCTGCSGTDGVTIVLTSRDGTGIGTVDFGGTTSVDLKPPSGPDDPYKGIVMYQDRRAAAGNAFRLRGTTGTRITGAVYAPSAYIEFHGNAALVNGRKCIQLVGKMVTFAGNPYLSVADCASYGTPTISAQGSQSLRLLE